MFRLGHLALTTLLFACSTPAAERLGAFDDTAAGTPNDTSPRDTPPTGPAGSAAYQSGTRLKRRMMYAEDGAAYFNGWYDAELDRGCGFRIAADGELRCLPSSTFATAYYRDALCAEPVLLVNSASLTCSTPTYISAPLPRIVDCTSTRNAIYEQPRRYEGPLWTRTSTCDPVTDGTAATSLGSYTAYTGTRIAPATFVRAAEGVE